MAGGDKSVTADNDFRAHDEHGGEECAQSSRVWSQGHCPRLVVLLSYYNNGPDLPQKMQDRRRSCPAYRGYPL